MRTVFIGIVTLILGVFGSPIPQNSDVYADPLCPGNIKNLWLDVVVVVDKSQLMTNSQLWQVRNTISQVFGAVSNIGPTKWPADPRSTCVGVVTYDNSSTVNAEVDASKSFSDLYNVIQSSLVAVDTTNTSYLSSGLLAAEKAFKDSRQRTYRYKFQQVVIAFAADYQGSGTIKDAKPVANRLKNNGVSIITVSCTNDPNASNEIQSLASPGFNFIDEMNTAKLVKQLTNALLSVNCFCPSDYTQYRADYHDPTSTQYGICIKGYIETGSILDPYQHAIDWCEYEATNGILVNEFSKQKHDFITYYMNDAFGVNKPQEYYIGLRYLKNQWVWEQPTGQERIPLDPNGWTNWAPGYPQANSTGQVIADQPWTKGSSEFVWAPPQTDDFYFVCQAVASSTENFTGQL
ncbi:hypothetical protein GCK72_005530 [Caenorhabditis remanei]|uniref:C-type LECtin n=1 Tax=Caenorhabditis remanei TaxID=31234 RepID=A0A6A5HCU4_CAERE|nr:hypothetical protein GCK72_005530 [Caenorhabditis remanei]KAF1765578.1 hypothetical protein GCK72_005530 [Caenorhabditis remanei]